MISFAMHSVHNSFSFQLPISLMELVLSLQHLYSFLSRYQSADSLCWLWYVFVDVFVGLISIFMRFNARASIIKMASTSSNKVQEFKEYIANRIRIWTEELLLQHFQQSGHDVQRCIPWCEGQGRLSYAGHRLASTPNEVVNCSSMVAIPMQNKKEILNNKR